MMPQRLKQHLPDAAVVVSTGLLGMSLARVTYPEAPDYLLLGGGGALSGLFIVVLLNLLRNDTGRTEHGGDPLKLRGFKIMGGGLIGAFVGWLVAVFVWFPLGFVIVVAAILIGVFGLVVHFVHMSSE